MKQRLTLGALVILAIVLRLAADFYVGAAHAPRNENGQIAMHVVAGQGFSFNEFQYVGPTSVRAPLYPLLLAAVQRLSGDAYWAGVGVLIGNALAAGGVVVVAFAFARRFGRSDRVAWVFAVLMAVWPTQIYAATFVQGLTISILLSLIAMEFLWRCRENPQISSAVIAGAAIAFALLTEASLTLPLLFVAVFALARRPKELATAALTTAVFVGPWIYRNTLVHGSPTGLTNAFDRDLYLGNGHNATGSFHLETPNFAGRPTTRIEQMSPRDVDTLRRKPEAFRNHWMAGETFKWIGQHPAEYARLCGVRVAKTLWLDWHHPQAFQVLNFVTRSIAVMALILAVVLRRRFALPLFWCAGVVVACALTLAEARSAAFMDVGQLLALALLADKRLGD